jgi:O-antigen/teichoic acid export membrane protein
MSCSESAELAPRAWLSVPHWLRKASGVFLSMAIVNAGNYAVNIVYGRYLSPAIFGEVVFTTTWLLIVGALSLAIQSATARGIASAAASRDESHGSAVVRDATHFSATCGVIVSLLLACSASRLTTFFHLSSRAPFVWLALIAPPLFVQGARRGVLQGRDRTARFTWTFQAEMLVRLGGSWLALSQGLKLDGVCAALFLSVIASLIATGKQASGPPREISAGSPDRSFGRMIMPAFVAQLSVIAFTQVDIVILKARALPAEVGAFAAVVLIGRIVSFAAQAVTTPLLPAVVGRIQANRGASDLLRGALIAVAAIGVPLVALAYLAPVRIVATLFGHQHIAAAAYLAPYTVAILLHGLASVVTDYAFCCGAVRVNYVSAGVGGLKLILALALVHAASSAVLLSVASSALLLLLTSLATFAARRRF